MVDELANTTVEVNPNSDEVTSVQADSPEDIVQSIMELSMDSKKAQYIGYRASGFSMREACALINVHQKTISRWREGDIEFVKAEANISELRKKLGIEYARVEFLRNYRLVLEKDFRIIAKSLRQPNDVSKTENDYLLKARGHYTPQQLETMERLLSGGAKEEEAQFNFTDFVVKLSRTRVKDEMIIEGKTQQLEDGGNGSGTL